MVWHIVTIRVLKSSTMTIINNVKTRIHRASITELAGAYQ
jgi:hypothetical protein